MSHLTRPAAVLFDVDGTLVDSNYLHVSAWHQAFLDVGRTVPVWRIHRAIGMDSSRLLSAVLGDDADRLGDDAKSQHAERYAALGRFLRPLPGARDLVSSLSDAGLAVVLATSAPPEELDRLREVLDVDAELTATTDSDDVETAKPAPDVVGVALERAGVAAADALFVGDATWDAEAAGQAGVTCVAVRSGGTGDAELRAAGAVGVFDDAAAVLAAITDDDEKWLTL
ncbi:HAD family hydrolase [Jatrophihabitans sp. YIM 134969]